MFKMNAGYFLIQLSSEKDKERVYKLIGQYSRPDANGVPQVCFIGVTNPQNPRVETPQEVCDDLLLASKYIPRATRLNGRLRFLALQHRREAETRFAGRRAGYRLPKNQIPRGRNPNGIRQAGRRQGRVVIAVGTAARHSPPHCPRAARNSQRV
jgi:hypothetical protein